MKKNKDFRIVLDAEFAQWTTTRKLKVVDEPIYIETRYQKILRKLTGIKLGYWTYGVEEITEEK
jgi:hypothetical protein